MLGARLLAVVAGLCVVAGQAAAQDYGIYRYYGPAPGLYGPGDGYYPPPPPPPPGYGYYVPSPLPEAYSPPPGYHEGEEEDYFDPYAPPPPFPRPRETERRAQPPDDVPPLAPAKRDRRTASAERGKTGPQGPASCTKAQDVVADYGFGNVKPETCQGKLYAFSALRDGKTYRVQVSAATGEITEVKKQP